MVILPMRRSTVSAFMPLQRLGNDAPGSDVRSHLDLLELRDGIEFRRSGELRWPDLAHSSIPRTRLTTECASGASGPAEVGAAGIPSRSRPGHLRKAACPHNPIPAEVLSLSTAALARDEA